MEMAQVGERTRARAIALAAATVAATSSSKKRKIINNNNNNQTLSYNIEVKSNNSKRRVMITSIDRAHSTSVSLDLNSGVNLIEEENEEEQEEDDDRCFSPNSDHASASCCSSNGSSTHIVDDNTIINDQKISIKLADLQDESRSVEVGTSDYYSCRRRRENTPSSQSSDELDSAARPASTKEANSHRRSSSSSTVRKMPTESELEDFFAEAEKNIQKQFAKKYNYDIVKDEPVKGRYEWVRLKQ